MFPFLIFQTLDWVTSTKKTTRWEHIVARQSMLRQNFLWSAKHMAQRSTYGVCKYPIENSFSLVYSSLLVATCLAKTIFSWLFFLFNQTYVEDMGRQWPLKIRKPCGSHFRSHVGGHSIFQVIPIILGCTGCGLSYLHLGWPRDFLRCTLELSIIINISQTGIM